MRRLLFILLAVFVVFIGGGPYYVNVFPVRVLHHVVLTLVLGGWLIGRLRRGRGLPSTPLDAPLVAAVLVWIVTTVLSANPRMAVESLWFPFVHLLLFYFIAAQFERGNGRLLFETQYLLAALAALLALAQLASWYFGLNLIPGMGGPGWASVIAVAPIPLTTPMLYLPLGVSTWLAAYVAPQIVTAFAWSRTARGRDFQAALLVLAIILLVILAGTGSRGGIVALGVAVIVWAGLRAPTLAARFGIDRRLALLAPLFLFGGIALVLVLLLSRDISHSSGDVLRLSLWRVAVQTVRADPLTGFGVGQFGRGIREFRDADLFDERLGTAHNIVLNTAAETGIPGALVLLWMAGATAWAWQRRWRGETDSARKLRLEAAFAALCGFAAQSLFDNFTSTAHMALIALLAAYCTVERQAVTLTPHPSPIANRRQGRGETNPLMALSPSPSDPQLGAATKSPEWGSGGEVTLKIGAWLALLALLGFAFLWVMSDRAQAAFIRSTRNGDLAAVQEAVSIDPSLHLYKLQVAYLLGLRAENDPAALEAAITAYQTALTYEPTWDTGWTNLGVLYERLGDPNMALAAFSRARAISPYNAGWWNWARLAEAYNLASEADITAAYDHEMRFSGYLPLSDAWEATPLRRQVLDTFISEQEGETCARLAERWSPLSCQIMLPDVPATAWEWSVVGERALQEGDNEGAVTAFTQAIALAPRWGDYYLNRGQALLDTDLEQAQTDLRMAQLVGTYYVSSFTVQNEIAQRRGEAVMPLRGFPSRVVSQNFEGVLYNGRTASFEVFPEARRPGRGRATYQLWYQAAAERETAGQWQDAALIYQGILAAAPDETWAAERLAALTDEG